MNSAADLPPEFVQRMGALLGDDLDSFLAAVASRRARGVRVNSAKISAGALGALLGADLLSAELRAVPWCPTGFLLPPDAALGGHPAHVAGLFYLQEPSAMSVAEALAPPPGARVADLAAAPGGKTTHLASLVGPDGLVLAVDADRGRLGSLHESLDMWGAPQVVTMSMSMERLAETGIEPFDAAVLDAPCSGEALFRRRPAAIRDWSPAMVGGCAKRQSRMLSRAADLVAPGGVLVYSTCTFEVAENEDQLAGLLAAQPDWQLEELTVPGASAGLPADAAPTQRAARLWPHRVEGDGQFVARLRRSESPRAPRPAEGRRGPTAGSPHDHPAPRDRRGPAGGRGPGGHAGRGKRPGRADGQDVAASEISAGWSDFHSRYLPGLAVDADRLLFRGDRAFLLPRPSLGIDADLLARPGLPLGRQRPGRFEPAPALATALTAEQAAETISWPARAPDLLSYLRGETVPSSGPDGWVLICFDQWPLAWARRRGGVLKNLVPGHIRGRVARAAARG